jgi:NADPH-dependent glutamate synthase beta subunit-like oxidoreductase/coenzyme F420-reducing hydrogenase delta subunit
LKKDALIIGSSPAGIQAALDLANSGNDVHLVESNPFLKISRKAKLPHHLLNARMLELAKHPHVTLWTNTDLTHLEPEAGSFKVQLRQHPRFVDLNRCTGCGDCIEVCPVTVPGTSHKAIVLANGSQPGCAAIDKAGKPPCTDACPGGIRVQGYVALIAQGRFQEALGLIREAIPFPSICGRICTHPCELNCRRSEVDEPVAIRQLKRFVADWELTNAREQVKEPNQITPPVAGAKRIAIVGSGPAGMAAAHRLAGLGYQVTVFEKLPVMAGMLAVGIPAYRLPRNVIAAEYSYIQKLGVEIKLNTSIGPDGDYTIEDLFAKGYNAVCLAIGAHKSLTLGISGEKLPGVVFGIELLKTISLSQQIDNPDYKEALKKILRRGAKTRVAVLGGGNTAMDVARSLKRLGVADLRIVYRRSRKEMPALPEEVAQTEQEGIPIDLLTAPIDVLGDQTKGVNGLRCLRMQLGEPDDSGRRRPVPIAGSEFEMPLDLVVMAIGQIPDAGLLIHTDGIDLTRDQRIKVDSITFATDQPGVFAAGDAITRDNMSAIEAIGMGKKVAAAIDAYLRGQASKNGAQPTHELPVARREIKDAELKHKPRSAAPLLSMDKRLNSFEEVERPYSEEQAVTEAQRCLACGPCSECLACVSVCKPNAVVQRQTEKYAELQIGSIIYASDPDRYSQLSLSEGHGIYRVPPEDPLRGSAVAADALSNFLSPGQVATHQLTVPFARSPVRVGVFVCQCGDAIEKVVDTQTICQQATDWAEVVTSQVLPFACSPEAGRQINDAVLAQALNRVVLAACACCSLDQVCYSCSYQRIRCKQNLDSFGNTSAATQLPESFPIGRVAFEFVNIREQCAWVHADDPQAATAKATALVAAAVTKMRMLSGRWTDLAAIDHSTLIIGNGEAVEPCQEKLIRLGIAVSHVANLPNSIKRTKGFFVATHNSHSQRAASVALMPKDGFEADRLWTALEPEYQQLNLAPIKDLPETRRPGVFYCDPTLDGSLAGAATAARIRAWLGRCAAAPQSNVAVVDPHRCRACSTCVEICEFGAPQLTGREPNRTSTIDPFICTGCGTCAAHCPSGAITAGYSTDAQLEGMIETALSDGAGRYQNDNIVVFTCNWSAYNGLETAGLEHRCYSASVYPIKVMCLGRLGPGFILKTLEKGASGVLMLGCPQGECRYEFGGRSAEESFAVASELMRKLGYVQKRLKMDRLAAGDGKALTETIRKFLAGLNGDQVSR